MPSTAAPQDVLDAVRSAREALTSVGPLAAPSGSSAEWAEALGALRSLVDVATARQDEVLVRLAAIEPMVLDDGELVETHRAPGHASSTHPPWSAASSTCPRRPPSRGSATPSAAPPTGPRAARGAPGWAGCIAAMASGALDDHRAHVTSRASSRGRPPTSLARSSTPSHRGSSGRTRAGCGAGSVESSPVSLPTCSGSERSARVRPPAAALGRRARRRHVARHLPVRGGVRGLGRRRRPRAALRGRRHLRHDRPGPGQGPDRPRRRPRLGRSPGRHGLRGRRGPPGRHARRGRRPRWPRPGARGGRMARHGRLPPRRPPRRVHPGPGPALPLPRLPWSRRGSATSTTSVPGRPAPPTPPTCPPLPSSPPCEAASVWRVTLPADGELTWLDPAGRTRTTRPPDPARARPAMRRGRGFGAILHCRTTSRRPRRSALGARAPARVRRPGRAPARRLPGRACTTCRDGPWSTCRCTGARSSDVVTTS